MKRFGMVILLSMVLIACEKDQYVNTDPSVETLEEELKTAPTVEDSLYTHDFPAPEGPHVVTCYDKNSIQNARDLGYELVVVIDKAAAGQTFKVYRNGELVADWKTSTGKELAEAKKSKSGRWTRMSTPLGFYTPTKGRLYGGFDNNGDEIIYTSKTWDTPMPNAIFFNGGVAIHQTEKSNFKRLGSRASGGCVRLHSDVAKDFFDLVKFEVGMGQTVALDKHGCIKKDEADKVVIVNGYRTLIVIRDSSL